MRILKKLAILVFCTSLLLGPTSCIVVPGHGHGHPRSHDNGKHKGWFKHSKKPHQYNSSKHGHSKKKHHK